VKNVGLLAGAFALCCCGENPRVNALCDPSSGIVHRVIDGDTIELSDGIRVRYLLIDTPELDTKDCLSVEATALNSQLVLGRKVRLEYDGGRCTDRFGRNLAYVEVDDRQVNRIMVERGYAKVLIIRSQKYPEPYVFEEEFQQLETEAKFRRAGLWGFCQ